MHHIKTNIIFNSCSLSKIKDKCMRYFILLFVVILSGNIYGQHCPYDGSNLIAIKLVDQKGHMLSIIKDTVYLMEIDNPLAGSCTYAPGLLKIPFQDTSTFFANCDANYRPVYSNDLKRRLKELGITGKANLLLKIGQAERYCMIKDNNDFAFQDRKFAIVLYHNNKQVQVPVPAKDIRSLCTGSKDLLNFTALVVKMD